MTICTPETPEWCPPTTTTTSTSTTTTTTTDPPTTTTTQPVVPTTQPLATTTTTVLVPTTTTPGREFPPTGAGDGTMVALGLGVAMLIVGLSTFRRSRRMESR